MRQKLTVGWLRQNWILVIFAIFSAISTFFGGVTGFLDLVQQVLNIHPTLFQSISFVLFIGGTIGLVTVAILIIRKPRQVSGFVQYSRLDSFNARIDREQYEPEQIVTFSMDFKGKLRAGYYEAVIMRPDRTKEYWWDKQTLHFPRMLQAGELRGDFEQKNYPWTWEISINHPEGEYTAHVGVYDCYPEDRITYIRLLFRYNWFFRKIFKKDARFLDALPRPAIAQKTLGFKVARRLPDEPDVSAKPDHAENSP